MEAARVPEGARIIHPGSRDYNQGVALILCQVFTLGRALGTLS